MRPGSVSGREWVPPHGILRIPGWRGLPAYGHDDFRRGSQPEHGLPLLTRTRFLDDRVQRAAGLVDGQPATSKNLVALNPALGPLLSALRVVGHEQRPARLRVS